MNLYELREEYLKTLDSIEVDEETGEVLGMDLVDLLAGAFEEKAESVALYIKELLADAKAIREEEKALADRRAKKERKAEAMKDYLANALLALDRQKLETPKVALSFRKSQSVEITDDSLIPEDYIKYKPAVDKTAIKAALKDGAFIPGAELRDAQNLQIK